MEYVGVNHLFPEWQVMLHAYILCNIISLSLQMWDQFLVLDEFPAMSTDSLLSTHALHASDIETPAQINELFDSTSVIAG